MFKIVIQMGNTKIGHTQRRRLSNILTCVSVNYVQREEWDPVRRSSVELQLKVRGGGHKHGENRGL